MSTSQNQNTTHTKAPKGAAHAGRPPRGPRPKRTAQVTNILWLSPTLVRLSFHCPDLVTMKEEGQELGFTDHYIKIIFSPADHPEDARPITRTYTLRSYDQAAGTFDVDFVSHGDEGLAGPWAAKAEIGDSITFMGPGGGWAPNTDHQHFVFAGDESAAPAICAGLEQLPEGATATAFIEVENTITHFEISPQWPNNEGIPNNITIKWVERNGATPGTELSRAVQQAEVPHNTSWFIHGVAEMIRELRAFLFVQHQVPKSDVSISGYWRLGMIEDQWQATKREFVTEMENAEMKDAEMKNTEVQQSETSS